MTCWILWESHLVCVWSRFGMIWLLDSGFDPYATHCGHDCHESRGSVDSLGWSHWSTLGQAGWVLNYTLSPWKLSGALANCAETGEFQSLPRDHLSLLWQLGILLRFFGHLIHQWVGGFEKHQWKVFLRYNMWMGWILNHLEVLDINDLRTIDVNLLEAMSIVWNIYFLGTEHRVLIWQSMDSILKSTKTKLSLYAPGNQDDVEFSSWIQWPGLRLECRNFPVAHEVPELGLFWQLLGTLVRGWVNKAKGMCITNETIIRPMRMYNTNDDVEHPWSIIGPMIMCKIFSNTYITKPHEWPHQLHLRGPNLVVCEGLNPLRKKSNPTKRLSPGLTQLVDVVQWHGFQLVVSFNPAWTGKTHQSRKQNGLLWVSNLVSFTTAFHHAQESVNGLFFSPWHSVPAWIPTYILLTQGPITPIGFPILRSHNRCQ